MNLIFKHREKIILSLIIILGASLRFFNIDTANFWRDEAFTIKAATMNFSSMWEVLKADTAPPLFTVILHFWLKVVELNETTARIPSFVFGVLSIYYTYLLAKELFPFSRTYIYLTTLLIALNPVLIYYSQEARAYSLLALLSTASLYLIIKISNQQKNNYQTWTILGLVTILGLLTHNLFLFIALVNAIVVFFVKLDFKKLKQTRIDIFSLFLTYLVTGLLYLPWFLIMLKQITVVEEGGFWLSLDPINDPLKLAQDVFAGKLSTSGHILATDFANFAKKVLLGMLIFGSILTVARYRKHDKFNSKLLLTIYWLLLNFLLVFIYSFDASFIYIRYMIYLVIPANILAVIPIINTRSLPPTIKFMVVGFALISMSIFALTTINNIPNSKAPMKTLITDLEQVTQDDTLVLHSHAYTHHAFNLYTDIPNKVYNPDQSLPYFEGLAVLRENDYHDKTDFSEYEKVIVIYLEETAKETEPTQILRQSFLLSKSYNYSDQLYMDIWIRK